MWVCRAERVERLAERWSLRGLQKIGRPEDKARRGQDCAATLEHMSAEHTVQVSCKQLGCVSCGSQQ
jgi:hypothetical protein